MPQNSLEIDASGSGHALRRHAAHRVPPHEPQPDPARRPAVVRSTGSARATACARERRARGRARARSPTCCASVDTPRSKPSRPIAMRQPSSTSPTTSVGLGAGVVEEHLVELAAAGDLHDRPHLDAGLVHRARAGTTGPCGASTRDRCARTTKHQCDTCASDVHTFWPLIDPLVAVELGAGLRRWRGRSRRWARCSPGTSARRRAGCRGGSAPAARRCRTRSASGASRFSPMWLTRAGASRARVLLGPDHLLRRASRRARRTPPASRAR